MRVGYGRCFVVPAVAVCALVVFAAASAAAKPVRSGGPPMPSRESAASAVSGGWGAGVEAALPANSSVTNYGASIESISCPSAGNCTAVGGYNAISGGGGLLLTETAGRWAAGVEAVLPANANPASSATVESVSCASAGFCTAVGRYRDDSSVLGTTHGLLLTETAGSWSAGIEAVLPANASSNPYLQWGSVSCASAGNCTAVGTYSSVTGDQGLLLSETDGNWSAGIEAVAPVTPSSAYLNSVSCASAGNCTAGGGFYATSGGGGLLLTETAGSWAPGVEPALPADARTTEQNAELSSVSCASAGNCTAVGLYDISDVPVGRDLSEIRGKGLLLTETGGNWATGVEATLPGNAVGPDAVNEIYPPTVSCPSVGNCSAVGSYYDNNSGLQGLLLTQNAGSWATGVASSTGVSVPGFLNAVSCASPGNCGALVSGYLLTETAGSWGAGVEPSLPVNAAPGRSLLYSASCGSAGNCNAVGTYWTKFGVQFGLLIGGSPASVALGISKKGTGAGTVSSAPTGIDCGPTCSASFDSGTSVTLTARPAPGSRFSGWAGGGSSGTGSWQPNTSISNQTVTATFNLLPKCVVPKLKGKTLKAGRHAIRTHNCAVGKIKHARSQTIAKGHVISQWPKPGRRLKHGAKVNLVVSNGRR